MKELKFHRQNLLGHLVDEIEAAEAMDDGWGRRRRNGENFEILGRTSEGRYLQIVCEERSDFIRAFHGRDMTKSERHRYERERKL